MTPEWLTGLAALALEFRDWVRDHDPGHLDSDIADALIEACARRRRELVTEGAK